MSERRGCCGTLPAEEHEPYCDVGNYASDEIRRLRQDRVDALYERDQAIAHRDDYENVYIDQGIKLREARDLAKSLLALLEGYLRLDVAAPKRIRDEAATAREKIAGWGTKEEVRHSS